MKKLFIALLGLIVALVAAFLLFRTPDTNPVDMLAKYGGPQAKFAEGPGGMRVHFRDQGNPDGPPIILIHGLSASLHTWEPLVARLGGEFRIITYDQPGHGLSSEAPDNDYSPSGLMRAVAAVADAAGVDHFILGGSSMGGRVAWHYALDHPERVDALILVDAAGAPSREGEKPPPLNLGLRLASTASGRWLLQQFLPRSLIEKSIRETFSKEATVDEAMIERYWELVRLPSNRRAMAYVLTADHEPEMAEHLSEIDAPTLIVWGADDNIIHASAAKTFHEQIPNSQVHVYDGVGHLPMEEAPDRTANDIRRFLESLPPVQ